MERALLPPTEALSRRFDLPQQPLPSRADISQAKQTESFHGVQVGDLGLLLASDKLVSEIFETLPQCELPNTPPWVHAMANQRGNIIPIFNLAMLLGLPRKKTNHSYYLVIGQNENAFGMLLDQLPEKVTLRPDNRLDNRPPIPAKLAPFIRRCFERDEKIWLEWEPLAFISSITANA